MYAFTAAVVQVVLMRDSADAASENDDFVEGQKAGNTALVCCGG